MSDETSTAVLALDKALVQAPPEGLRECVPAYVSLLVEFDPLVTDHTQIRSAIEQLLQQPAAERETGTVREVEVCYEGDLSPDIAEVARTTGLSIEAAINCHLQGEYRVRMYGFAPGYAYMSGVPLPLQIPRKPAALRDIPAGSVLIAGVQCLVTTLTMPTGWHILGRSPTRILTGNESTPFLFDVGDKVRFKRIDLARYEEQKTRSRNA